MTNHGRKEITNKSQTEKAIVFFPESLKLVYANASAKGIG